MHAHTFRCCLAVASATLLELSSLVGAQHAFVKYSLATQSNNSTGLLASASELLSGVDLLNCVVFFKVQFDILIWRVEIWLFVLYR